jgi:roadblock/LC7 domain-containing protein
MATLDELMTIQGVVAAGEFTPGGELVDFRSAVTMPSEQARLTAQCCATVSNLFGMLAEAYTRLHNGQTWVPPKWWVYAGGDMAVCVGGTKGVFVRLGQADFTQLYKSLAA